MINCKKKCIRASCNEKRWPLFYFIVIYLLPINKYVKTKPFLSCDFFPAEKICCSLELSLSHHISKLYVTVLWICEKTRENMYLNSFDNQN